MQEANIRASMTALSHRKRGAFPPLSELYLPQRRGQLSQRKE